MTEVPASTTNCYMQLVTNNGIFFNTISFKFDEPKILNDPPYKEALLGTFSINTRNYVGKYQGNYILYIEDGIDLIRLKIKSLNTKSELSVNLTDEEKSKVSLNNDAIIIKFEDFISLVNDQAFFLND
jgi:hypothetical protein